MAPRRDETWEDPSTSATAMLDHRARAFVFSRASSPADCSYWGSVTTAKRDVICHLATLRRPWRDRPVRSSVDATPPFVRRPHPSSEPSTSRNRSQPLMRMTTKEATPVPARRRISVEDAPSIDSVVRDDVLFLHRRPPPLYQEGTDSTKKSIRPFLDDTGHISSLVVRPLGPIANDDAPRSQG